jgi:nucleoside-diphosphate-sugar epimerase
MFLTSIVMFVKILVSGASSYVGSHVSRSLHLQGHDVVGTFRRSNSRTESLATELGVKVIQVDLAAKDDFARLPTDFDAVVHNAGSFPWIDVDIENVVNCNVVGTKNLTKWLKKRNSVSRIVMYSTLSVYGNIVDKVLTEKTPTNSHEIYGSSKLASEHLMIESAGCNNQLIIRFPIVLGKNAHRAFIPQIVENFTTNQDVEISNPNKFYNSMTTLKAVSDFTNNYLNSKLSGKSIVNIGAEKPQTISQIVEFLKSQTGSKSLVTVNNIESNCYLIDNFEASKLGYVAPSVQEALEYYASESNWQDA